MKLFIGLSFFAFIFLVNGENFQLPEDNIIDGQFTFNVDDCFDFGEDQEFLPRSTVHVKSIRSSSAVVTHTRKWSPEHTKQLKKLAEDNGLYRIRVYQPNTEEKRYISTFTKACQVYESGLTETISVMVDGNGHAVISVSLHTPVSACAGMDIEDFPLKPEFNTSILVRSPTVAPIPDTATYIRKMEVIKSEKAEGKDNRSFLAKYWMYIVPIVLFVLISGGGQEEARR